MTPSNINNLEAKRLRQRARKMLELRGLGWSQREIAEAMNPKISRNMVVKTLDRIANAKEGTLYWELKK